ncbi:MAG: hypothetical protein WCT10_00415 [Patescibacteria group bacterium]|jgi:hypothetical protein
MELAEMRATAKRLERRRVCWLIATLASYLVTGVSLGAIFFATSDQRPGSVAPAIILTVFVGGMILMRSCVGRTTAVYRQIKLLEAVVAEGEVARVEAFRITPDNQPVYRVHFSDGRLHEVNAILPVFVGAGQHVRMFENGLGRHRFERI